MERFLRQTERGKKRLIISSLLILMTILVTETHNVYATNYTAWVSGYAFGNLYGKSGNVVSQTDFANHQSSDCPNDPAAYWPYGTQITMVNPSSVPLRDAWGRVHYISVFTLDDKGDRSCQGGNYWADIYFGRYKNPSDPCVCSGVTGVCVNGTDVNNCADVWGAATRTYNK
jgi:hypothetical protein